MTKDKMPEYRAYHDAKNRCTNPNNKWFSSYGAKGIKFNINSFEDFFKFLGEKPTKTASLDRIDPSGDYELTNIRWATKTQQSFNQRKSSDNKSGITGVGKKKNKFWYASGSYAKTYYHLYCGPDFFDACCARKSWESTISG